MGRTAVRIGMLALAGVAVATLALYRQIATVREARVTHDVIALETPRVGGNVSVLRTRDGVVVVDTMAFPRLQGRFVRERAERFASGPVQLIVNTHSHLDHVGGDAAFPVGTRLLATVSTRRRLEAEAGAEAGERTLPTETVSRETELRIGGKTLRLLPLAGHTDGDLAVLFVEDRVLASGDLVFHRCYPNLDLEAGGSIPVWIESLNRLLELDFDRVVPGHGDVTDREGVLEFQGFLRELWRAATRAVDSDWSLERTLREVPFRADRGYRELGVPLLFRLDRRFVLRRAWEEARARRQSDGTGGSPES